MPDGSFTVLPLDLNGVGPVVGTVRWAHAGKFGVLFTEQFDMARLAAKRQKANEVTMLQPWYVPKTPAKAAS